LIILPNWPMLLDQTPVYQRFGAASFVQYLLYFIQIKKDDTYF